MRDVVAATLRCAGHVVQTAASGTLLRDALARAHETGCLPDVVASDIVTPGLRGTGVLAWARAQGTSVAFLMMTAFGNDAIAEARALGAGEVFEKPFELDLLLDVIDRIAPDD